MEGAGCVTWWGFSPALDLLCRGEDDVPWPCSYLRSFFYRNTTISLIHIEKLLQEMLCPLHYQITGSILVSATASKAYLLIWQSDMLCCIFVLTSAK